MAKAVAANMDWNHLGFQYWDLPYRYQAVYRDGEWHEDGLIEDSSLTFSEAAEDLHYGQEVFEGLKAYRCKDGSVNLFRPDMNAQRMENSAKRLSMVPFPKDKFVEAVKAVVKANQDFVPPYETGASLYLRPFMVGTEPMVGVKPSKTYVFRIFATPVGAYIKGLTPMPYMVSDYDRAAYAGTGQAKTAGNYAGSLYPAMKAKAAGFADCLYLDPREHKYIDEFGGANFYGITKDGQFVTPKSDSILPSVTKKSILRIAERQGLNPVETQIKMADFDQFAEAGAMGTAAVISPVGSLTYKDQKYVPFSETEAGPVTKKLYEELLGIQYSEREDFDNWVQKVDLK